MTKNDGGQAFPVFNKLYGTSEGGMSLRDWLAGHAMAAMIANPNTPKAAGAVAKMLAMGDQEYIAATAYSQADAVLAEREKRDAG